MVKTSEAYYYGLGTVQSYQKSLFWADQARVDELDSEQQCDLALQYQQLALAIEEGNGDFLSDPKKAKIVYKKAYLTYLNAAKEDSFWGSESCKGLARLFRFGKGVSKDLNECINWSLKAGEKGDVYGFEQASHLLLEAGKRTQAEGVWKRYFEVFKRCCNHHDECMFLIPRPHHPNLSGESYGETYNKSVECGAISPIHTHSDIAALNTLLIAMRGAASDKQRINQLADFLEWLKSTLAKT